MGDGPRSDERVVELSDRDLPAVWRGPDRILDAPVGGKQTDLADAIVCAGRGQGPLRSCQQVRSCRAHIDAYHFRLVIVD